MILADVRPGTIVRVRGEWGVVCKGKVVDFWWRSPGRVQLLAWTVVEVPA